MKSIPNQNNNALSLIDDLDRALRSLYRVNPPCRASDFVTDAQGTEGRGAVLVKKEEDALYVRIFLDQRIQACLSSFARWTPRNWSTQQYDAFSVAAEELSHFHYILYQVGRDRAVSELELEFQGEIDRFLLTYLANDPSGTGGAFFDPLFERLFEQIQFDPRSGEGKVRYEQANRLAAKFILMHREAIQSLPRSQEIWTVVRRFYRLGLREMLEQTR